MSNRETNPQFQVEKEKIQIESQKLNEPCERRHKGYHRLPLCTPFPSSNLPLLLSPLLAEPIDTMKSIFKNYTLIGSLMCCGN